jgi:hypothetical protein
MRTLTLLFAFTACGVIGGLPATSTATCTQDSDCTIPSCPNQCSGGQPACGIPKAYGVEEARQDCPCIDTPQASYCHPTQACPALDCAVFVEVAAFCRSSHCVALLPDGGALP